MRGTLAIGVVVVLGAMAFLSYAHAASVREQAAQRQLRRSELVASFRARTDAEPSTVRREPLGDAPAVAGRDAADHYRRIAELVDPLDEAACDAVEDGREEQPATAAFEAWRPILAELAAAARADRVTIQGVIDTVTGRAFAGTAAWHELHRALVDGRDEAAVDLFEQILSVTCDEMLAARRIPPICGGVLHADQVLDKWTPARIAMLSKPQLTRLRRILERFDTRMPDPGDQLEILAHEQLRRLVGGDDADRERAADMLELADDVRRCGDWHWKGRLMFERTMEDRQLDRTAVAQTQSVMQLRQKMFLMQIELAFRAGEELPAAPAPIRSAGFETRIDGDTLRAGTKLWNDTVLSREVTR